MIAAFAAGLVASVNPCGFAMLPAYAGFFLGIDSGDDSRGRVLVRGFRVAGLMSLGFLGVFGAAGLLIGVGGQGLQSALADAIPAVAIVVGAVLVFLGVMLLLGWEFKTTLSSGRGTSDRSMRGIIGFGASYALASLSCAFPVFLIVITQSVTAETFVGALGSFLAYAAGMSLMITAVTVALSLGRNGLVRQARQLSGSANRIAGALLVVAGGFIVFYWTLVLRLGADALSENPVTRWVESLSGDVTALVGDHPLITLGTIVVILGGTWGLSRLYASGRKTV